MATSKKTTTKKTAKKSVAKKTTKTPKVVKATTKASKSHAQNREVLFWGVVGYAIMVTLILALHMMFGGVGGSGSSFAGGGDGQDYHYDGERTWIAIDGPPVELTVLNDPACAACDPTAGIDALKKATTEAIVVKTLDVNTRQGKALAEKFDAISVPTFVLGKGFDELVVADGIRPRDTLGSILQERGGEYLVQSSALGLKPGQYIKDIPFSDLDKEPRMGNGKVRVVEFTDFQCPYCKRLYDNNRALIDRLIADGTIEYIVKDFPLSFHREAPAMHAAANCALKLNGQESYDAMLRYIFQTQSSFNKIGEPAAQERLTAQAATLGLDPGAFRSCITDPAVRAEIDADALEGRQYGVTGTPALFIGKQLIPGAIGPDRFEAAVNSQQ